MMLMSGFRAFDASEAPPYVGNWPASPGCFRGGAGGCRKAPGRAELARVLRRRLPGAAEGVGGALCADQRLDLLLEQDDALFKVADALPQRRHVFGFGLRGAVDLLTEKRGAGEDNQAGDQESFHFDIPLRTRIHVKTRMCFGAYGFGAGRRDQHVGLGSARTPTPRRPASLIAG